MFFNTFTEEWTNILLHYCTVHVYVITAAQAAPFFVCSSCIKSMLQHVQRHVRRCERQLTAEAVVLTYGDSMLFLKCVTDRGGSERTKHVHLAFLRSTLGVNQELNAWTDIRRWACYTGKSLKRMDLYCPSMVRHGRIFAGKKGDGDED